MIALTETLQYKVTLHPTGWSRHATVGAAHSHSKAASVRALYRVESRLPVQRVGGVILVSQVVATAARSVDEVVVEGDLSTELMVRLLEMEVNLAEMLGTQMREPAGE